MKRTIELENPDRLVSVKALFLADCIELIREQLELAEHCADQQRIGWLKSLWDEISEAIESSPE